MLKRLFDIFASLAAIVVLSPLLAVIVLAILLDDGAPVIYRQNRVGKGNELFSIMKFRTMKRGTRTAATAELAEAQDCITRTGKILRKSSFDELPQLFQILSGKMSVVGPRPLIPEEEEIRALREQYNVYSVRPGITGLAQINGRDNLTDAQKALYDKEYVENQSLWFDFKILLKTVMVVLRRENVVDGGRTDKPAKPKQ